MSTFGGAAVTLVRVISAYGGFALAAAAALEYTARLFVRRAVFSTRAHDVAFAVGAAIAAVSVAIEREPVWPAVGAGALLVTWFVYTRVLLRLPAREAAARPGDPLPDFSALRTDGTTFTRADLVAKAPAMLVVYRGRW